MKHALAVVVVALALGGCSTAAKGSTSPTSSTEATTANQSAAPSGAPPCADVTAPGKPATQAVIDGGCTMPDGTTNLLASSVTCGVVSYDPLKRWAEVGKTWQQASGDIAADPAYATAYHAHC